MDGGAKTKGSVKTVYALSRPSRCYGCDVKLLTGRIVKLRKTADEDEVLCAKCADLTGLVFLKVGNAQATRLAKKYSKSSYVVVKWSDLWKCYERQGILVEGAALERVEKETGVKLEIVPL